MKSCPPIVVSSLVFLWACGGAVEPQGESRSQLGAERPHDGEWALVGARPVIEREGYESEVLELAPGQLVADPSAAGTLDRVPDEGDHPVFVDDQGQLFLRTDRVIDLSVLRQGVGFFPGESPPTTGEVGDQQDKDIFNGDDRTRWSNTTSYPARAHVAIRSSPNGTTHFCSGAAIGPRHVLTAGHCLYRDGAFTKTRSELRVVFGQNGSGNGESNTPNGGKRSVVAWVLPNGWINEESRRYDYALLVLDDQSYSPGWLGFTAYDAFTLLGMNVNINGYPGHSYECAASPREDGLCGGYLYHGYGPLLFVTGDELLTHVDWEKGNSGGPLYRFTNNNRYVVGVVSASNSLFNTAARMRSGMSDALCSWIGSYPSSHFDHNCQ
ncbi:MAG: trypsin-like serine protease [Deltaproteobacteria bacterium]|jgi:V8-like Glu-specific endopeptidase|nr:trypsin-like serine protease [Deltaproteobacteria bacterium]